LISLISFRTSRGGLATVDDEIGMLVRNEHHRAACLSTSRFDQLAGMIARRVFEN
jgi:hypothetical protein